MAAERLVVEAFAIVPVVDQNVGKVAKVVEALVMVPVVDQKVGRVAKVVEALVIVPVVDQNVGKVAKVVEALSKVVDEATLRFPAKYPSPLTDKSQPGLLVPMPILPEVSIRARSTAPVWKIRLSLPRVRIVKSAALLVKIAASSTLFSMKRRMALPLVVFSMRNSTLEPVFFTCKSMPDAGAVPIPT